MPVMSAILSAIFVLRLKDRHHPCAMLSLRTRTDCGTPSIKSISASMPDHEGALRACLGGTIRAHRIASIRALNLCPPRSCPLRVFHYLPHPASMNLDHGCH